MNKLYLKYKNIGRDSSYKNKKKTGISIIIIVWLMFIRQSSVLIYNIESKKLFNFIK